MGNAPSSGIVQNSAENICLEVHMRVTRRRLVVILGAWLLAVATLASVPLAASAASTASTASAASAQSLRQEDLGEGWVMTASGPLGPADRDFLVKVRLAGLWEAPAGQMAQTKATSERVKEVGHHLATDHIALDEQVRLTAAKLNVDLPDQPNADQQGWLQELSGSEGAAFDQIFADRLRAAHGKVFAVIALVRAGTRNEVIRNFAQVGSAVVMKHMTLLESTGLVNFDDLPTAPAPGAAAVAPAANASRLSGGAAGINPNLVWLVLGIAAFAGLVTAARVVRPR
jgi:predicted outer membrane protein